MAIILGLASALTYGAADFLGGLATKRTKVLTVVLISQFFGWMIIVAALPFFTGSRLTSGALIWGGLSGIAGAIGIAFFYQGLAIGRMGAVAPITGVEAASVPVLWGLGTGERPGALALGGVVLALVAVGLVSAAEDRDADVVTAGSASLRHRWVRTGIAHAIVSGLAFGAFFILLDQSGEDTGVWPLVGARVSSVAVVGLAVLLTRNWERPPRSAMGTIAAAGALDVAANIFYLLATRRGLLSIVAVLTSMYPATTVILARVTLGERFRPIQTAGLLVAVAGVVAIALG